MYAGQFFCRDVRMYQPISKFCVSRIIKTYEAYAGY